MVAPSGADQAADAHGGRQVAHLGCAFAKDLEDGDHDQDVQAAADEGLRDGEPDEEARSRRPRNRLETGSDHPPDRLGLADRGETVATLDLDPPEHRRRRQKHRRTDDEDDADVRDRDEHACEQRADEGSETLDRRGRAVRRDELLRRPRERRQQRLQRRPHEGRGDPDEHGEPEHQDIYAGEGRRRRRCERS